MSRARPLPTRRFAVTCALDVRIAAAKRREHAEGHEFARRHVHSTAAHPVAEAVGREESFIGRNCGEPSGAVAFVNCHHGPLARSYSLLEELRAAIDSSAQFDAIRTHTSALSVIGRTL